MQSTPRLESVQGIATWLGRVSIDDFRQRYLSRVPLTQPATVSAAGLFDWPDVDHVLRSPAADVLVVAGGRLLPEQAPRSIEELRACFARGIGLCIRRAQDCLPGLRDVADRFNAELGASQVQLFVTPGGTHGFGWHYDDEDVFIAQTSGANEYYFRANTVAAEVPAHRASFEMFARETSVLCAADLVAGDFLYLPSRWWHLAMCRQDSLSVAIGVRPRPVMSA